MVIVIDDEWLLPDTSLWTVSWATDKWRPVCDDRRLPYYRPVIEYGLLVLRVKFRRSNNVVTIRNTVENVKKAFWEITHHWGEPGYIVRLWFTDTEPELLFESPAPEAVATGD